MTVAEYIVYYLKGIGIKHIFGYQGTMITNFTDAIYKEPEIINHSSYNEQGAALAACGYAKVSGELAVSYATSGPGALNLIQGIADAYYDSASVLFITGQLNLSEYSNIPELKQQGFQETNIVEITKSITKYSVFIDEPQKIIEELRKSISIATNGRKGPVLIDIPMDIQKAQIPDEFTSDDYHMDRLQNSPTDGTINYEEISSIITNELNNSFRPIFLIGNGISRDQQNRQNLRKLIDKYRIPVISSMLGKDFFTEDDKLYFGYLGSSYGQRSANIISNVKCDLIVSLGCRMCTRQTGVHQDKFATKAKIVRIDIDSSELKKHIHSDELGIVADANKVISFLLNCDVKKEFNDWIEVCNEIRDKTDAFDALDENRLPNRYIENISKFFNDPAVITADVGQNMVWITSSFKLKKGQSLLLSGAHGAMGFALPAAIGAYYATGKEVVCFAGDGGFQMNIQELQWIKRENIPIRIFVMNNNSLGMIYQVQEAYLEGRKIGTAPEYGFSSPSFYKIASAYGISSYVVYSEEELENVVQMCIKEKNNPSLVEVLLPENTKASPKTFFGDGIHDQRPYLPRNLFDRIMAM